MLSKATFIAQITFYGLFLLFSMTGLIDEAKRCIDEVLKLQPCALSTRSTVIVIQVRKGTHRYVNRMWQIVVIAKLNVYSCRGCHQAAG